MKSAMFASHIGRQRLPVHNTVARRPNLASSVGSPMELPNCRHGSETPETVALKETCLKSGLEWGCALIVPEHFNADLVTSVHNVYGKCCTVCIEIEARDATGRSALKNARRNRANGAGYTIFAAANEYLANGIARKLASYPELWSHVAVVTPDRLGEALDWVKSNWR